MRRTLLIAGVALTLAVGAVLIIPWAGSAEPAPEQARADDAPRLIVHEWGTYTTFSGANGHCLQFFANDFDLPDFVYSNRRNTKDSAPVYVSLETPVLYFYADRSLTASVAVEFPKGRMTEWFPNFNRKSKGLVWDNIKVLPGADLELPVRSGGPTRYYAARETDAAPIQVPVQVEGKNRVENEKFLFYRGVGDFGVPLSVTAQGRGKFTVKNTGKKRIPGLILVHIHDGRVRFQEHGHLEGGQAQTLAEPDKDATLDDLAARMVALLVEQGLYEKEAKSMVKTWSSAWFVEEGTRVVYLVPAEFTDAVLPLKVEPKPAELLRVMVGRHDILTPEAEQEVDGLVLKQRSPAASDRQAAAKELAKLLRFSQPAQVAALKRLKIER